MSSTITTSIPINSSMSATMNTVSAIGGYANTSIGTSGQYLSSGFGTTIVPNITWTDNMSPSTLTVQGDAIFEGNVTVQGKNLRQVLDNIEQRLAILHPNKELEDKWEDLKKLGDMYRQLEQEILEKEKMWDILKK